MIQAALGGGEDAALPTRYVFDEGHHVFDAADSAFAGHLTAPETAELRRWLLGAEGGREQPRPRPEAPGRGSCRRRRGGGWRWSMPSSHAARALPGEGWGNRLTDEMGDRGRRKPSC